SIYPIGGDNAEKLMKNADTAMYFAKEKGKNTYLLYTPDMGQLSAERLTLENDLWRALERDEFILHYQPQISVASGKLVGVEALIRWNHPKKGIISPAEFIPMAEETGLISAIGEWVLKTACMQKKAWQKAGYVGFKLAVNLSVRQF